MTDTTKTTAKTSKAKAAAAPKVQDAIPAAAETKSANPIDNPDALAHFIHHSPEFGTLALDEQDKLRKQLIEAKRAQQEGSQWPDGRKRVTLTDGDALADLNGTRRPDSHMD